MKWVPTDIEKFEESTEFIDTIVIPLLPISFGDQMKESAAMTEFTHLLTGQLEKQLQGRILLVPGFTYLKNLRNNAIEQLIQWEAEIMDKEIKHIFYVTSDMEWKGQEGQLKGTLLWLPSLPLQHMDEKSKISVMEDQVRQLMNLFIQKWRNVE